MQFEKMITEGSNTASAEIDRVSTLEMCRIINDEDKTVPLAVERVLPDIAAAIDVIHAQVREHPVGWGFWMPANVRPPTA